MTEVKKGDVVTLRITEINNLGCGVGKLGGMVIFVAGAVSGELVSSKIIKANKSYCVGKLEKVLEVSPYREDGFCSAPFSCGGCVYRHIRYEHELDLKRNYVKHAFIKAGLADTDVGEVLCTGRTAGYRNKAQYPLRQGKNGVEAGFYASHSHKIIASEMCSLQPTVFSEILNAFCRFASEKKISVYSEENEHGLLRHLYLRLAEGTGEIMVCVVINGTSLAHSDELCALLTRSFPQITGIMLNINRKKTNVVLGDEYRCLFGTPYITDTLCGRSFRISPGSFYQVNHDGAELLYRTAKELAALHGNEALLDLYCGIGTIGLTMSDSVGELTGIEIVPEAVRCAKENAELNGIKNAEFLCGDAASARTLLARALDGGRIPDAVILDPPRKGSTSELISYLAELKIPKIVYISCNPDTLARDCALFRLNGYNIGKVTPVDMFPRTGHVECAVLLQRQNS